jgi:Fic family protein
VTVHPFEDGNGRIARARRHGSRAIREQLAALYSMSAEIRRERNVYYEILERTQKGTLDVTAWMEWFLACLGRAIGSAQSMLAGVLDKALLGGGVAGASPERQTLINRLLDGMQGKLTTSKYATLARCSQDTALRDIAQLVERGLLVRGPEGGRSTSYSLAPARE